MIEANLSRFKDIRPAEMIETDFIFYFVLFVFSVFVCTFLLFYIRRRKVLPHTPRERSIHKLKSIDFTDADTKKIIYDFTVYGKESVEENTLERFEEILSILEPYKYTRETRSLENELVKVMKDYIRELK